MSSTDEDERRKRSLEAGREMLQRYKTERIKTENIRHSTNDNQTDDLSDEESLHGENCMRRSRSRIQEGMSSKDVTQSSISMSEGEGDGDLEGIAGRVAELEEILNEKEAVVEALNVEIDHLRAEASSPNSSQSQSSSIQSKDIIPLYQAKLQEFEKAINKRDYLIEDLTSSLQQAITERDALLAQLKALNAIQVPVASSVDMNFQEKINVLETTLSDQKAVINKLNAHLAEIHEHVQTLEMEKETRIAEINDYKAQINNLNEQIRLGATERNLNIAETLEQQRQYEARVDKIKQDMHHIIEKFAAQTNANTARHQQELKDLAKKHEAEITNISLKYEEHAKLLKEENRVLADRLNKELPDLESRHAKELSIFQAQLAHYKKTVESLKLELVNHTESQQTAQAEANLYKKKFEEFKIQAENKQRIQEITNQKEKEMLMEQINLHKVQIDDMMAKYIAATSILESKESMERSLEEAITNAATLRKENDTLKFELDDLSSKYSIAQSLIDNSQAHERTLNNKIHDLEKSLSRYSNFSIAFSELNETTYQTMDEVSLQYHLMKQRFEEKAELEKLLVEKIQNLEEDVRKRKEELEQANLAKKSYEKELKDMKNMCDKMKTEIHFLKESRQNDSQNSLRTSSRDAQKISHHDAQVDELVEKIENNRQETESLKMAVEQRESEIKEYIKKCNELKDKLKMSEEECDQLRNGLAAAWAQCADVEEKLSQTLAMNDSKIDISLPLADYSEALNKFFKMNKGDNTLNMSTSQCTENSNKSYKNEMDNSIMDITNTKFLQQENQNLLRELEQKLGKELSYDDIVCKLHYYYTLCQTPEKERIDKDRIVTTEENNQNLSRNMISSTEHLVQENKMLQKEIKKLIDQHKEEISAIKTDTAAEIKKMQSLVLSAKENNLGITDLKAELEIRHAKEMEELRTYFEEKCLQMEKQYSEEIFSQQSKKMSDNDSEIEELTEDLYFGGTGDCLSVSNISGGETPVGEEDPKKKDNNIQDNQPSKIESTFERKVTILEEELERKVLEIQDLKSEFEQNLQSQKKLYEKQIQEQKERCGRTLLLKAVNQHCQTEWDIGTLENGELSQLRAAYNHQLEEQVAQARLDIVNALQEQIQALLAVESDVEDNWPCELLELRDKFTNNAKRQMCEMKEAHNTELIRLKEEINKLRTEQNVSNKDFNITEERNRFHKACAMLKDLVGELIKYFIVCEEEVNNVLISELLKKQMININPQNDQSVREHEETLKEKDITANTSESPVKKVHFAPQFDEIVSLINNDNDTLEDFIAKDENITEKLKQELNLCLRRLKKESAQLFDRSDIAEQSNKLNVSSDDVAWMKKVNDELNEKLKQAETLIIDYEEESERMKVKIIELQEKLAIAETKKEIITEGYGEHDDGSGDVTLQDFSQLQEKARHVLSNGGGDCSYLMQIIEELCKQSDKLVDDSKREKEDLQQQVPLESTSPSYIHRVRCRKIEAADKQLRATRRFLEEQANEREAERDESAKQIHCLQEQLKEREREKERDLRITSETSLSREPSSGIAVLEATDIHATVEALEIQMREMSSLMSDTEAKKSETESELKAAIDKVWILRDIVSDLEQQLQTKIEKEESLNEHIKQLETVIAAQTKNQQDLVQELDAIKMGSENRQLTEHISRLEEELAKHKLSSEHFNVNSSALKQMKTELCEMQNLLDKRIKDLESVHMCGSNLSLSQPSEDVSFREQLDASRCATPDDPTAPPMLPLDQILKLKEKILKQARAEEVAFKRIEDLEMQLTRLKHQNEELQVERDILQHTASEQLFQIEAMRGRLEQHKQSAPFAQRQATSRLELQLHEANTKVQSLERFVADKELELKDIRNQLDRANQLLSDKEAEIANVVQVENITIQKLKDRVKVLEDEKQMLQGKLGAQEHAQIELPHLIDSMLADKNEEIDHLKEQLLKKDKQLEIYSSLALEDIELKEFAKETEAKTSARTLSDILSINSECEEVPEAIRAVVNQTLTQCVHNVSSFKLPTVASTSPKDISTALIETSKTIKVPPLDLGSNSQSLSNMCPQRLSIGIPPVENDSSKMLSPGNDLVDSITNAKSAAVSQQKTFADSGVKEKDLSTKESSNDVTLSAANEKDGKVSKETNTPRDIKSTEKVSELGNVEIQDLQKRLNEIEDELHAKSLTLDKREAEILALENQFEELQAEFNETVENLTRDRLFYKNEYETVQASENKIKRDLVEVENCLRCKTDELEEQKQKIQVNEKIIMELNAENTKLKKDLESTGKEEIKKYLDLLEEKLNELHTLKGAILEKDITIETIRTRNIEIENENKQLYEYRTKYQRCKQDLLDCQNAIKRLTEDLNNRDHIIKRLEEMARRTSLSDASSASGTKDHKEEIQHLHDYLKEKDRVIRQMSDDSKSLHRALETIQNKIKESGNVIELRKKLKEERFLNSKLNHTVEGLRKELEHLIAQRHDDADIEGMIQRELDLSARLDKQIMSVIENDTDEETTRDIEKYQLSGNNQYDNIAQKYLDTKEKLKQANQINEELIKLKDELEIEKQLLQDQVMEYENRILQIKSDLAEESKKVAKLDQELSNERNIVRSLKIQIEKEQRTRQSGHNQDSELIEFLQAKIRSSSENEEKLRNELSKLRQEHMHLEVQLTTIAEEMQSQKSSKLPGTAELLEEEQKKRILLIGEYEKEQKYNAELIDTLKKIEKEKDLYQKQLEIMTEEKEELISSLALVQGTKDHLETDLRRTKNELKMKEEECEWLQKRIKNMSDAENKRQEQRSREQSELKTLRREIDNAREVMMDLETDMKQTKIELTESIEREMELAEKVETLKAKEAELQDKLNIAKDEEKKLKDIIASLKEDVRIKWEHDQAKSDTYKSKNKDLPAMILEELKELNDANKKYVSEKIILENALRKTRNEKEQLAVRMRNLESQLKSNKGHVNPNPNNTDYLVEKFQHFYGKYLRTDSRRKALQYQKKYLLCIVGGYQLSEENTLSVLAQLSQSQRSYTRRPWNRKTPKARFKSVALAIISIHRMKWLIVRWRTGIRVGANVLLNNFDNSYISLLKSNLSPPVRDRSPVTTGERVLMGTSFEQYYQRLRSIQENLGLPKAETIDDHVNSE